MSRLIVSSSEITSINILARRDWPAGTSSPFETIVPRGGLIGPQGGVRPHPAAAGAITLCSKQPLGSAVHSRFLGERGTRSDKLINRQQGILRRERERSEEVYCRTPGDHVPSAEPTPKMLPRKRSELGLEAAWATREMQAEVARPQY